MNLREMLRKDVHIIAGGMAYRGTLIEVTEQTALLNTDSGCISVQMERISSIKALDEEVDEGFTSNKFISRSFYEFDNDE